MALLPLEEELFTLPSRVLTGAAAAALLAAVAGATLLARLRAEEDPDDELHRTASEAAALTDYLAASNRAGLERGCRANQYLALITATPSPSPPRWQRGVSAVELAQRRLAFAYSQLSHADGVPSFFWRGRLSALAALLSGDVVELVGRALAEVDYAPAPLRFCRSAGSGYAIDSEGGSIARAVASLAQTAGRLGDPRLRLALSAEAPMSSGRSSAAFTVLHMGRWSGVHLGVASCGAGGGGEGTAAGELDSDDESLFERSSFWGLHSGTGWLDHDGEFTEWEGMACFGQGDTMELLLDSDEGRLCVKKNGAWLGEVKRQQPRQEPLLPVERPLCWAVALHHRDDAIQLVRTDPAMFDR